MIDAEFHLTAFISASWYSTCLLTVTVSWLTGTVQKYRAIVVISNTCAFLTTYSAE